MTLNRRFRSFLAVPAAVMITQAAVAFDVDVPSGSYVNDPNHTRLLWKINHLGLSDYTARFNGVKIALELNAEDIDKSRVTATIDPRSVDTGYVGDTDFNGEIADDAKILNASKFPEIRFVSRSVEAKSDDRLLVSGELTLLGVTRPITLEAKFMGSTREHPFVKVPALGFSATASLDRTEFGQTFLSGVALGDDVTIEIQTEFIQQ